MEQPKRLVCAITTIIPHYRAPFHELVRERLSSEGIEYRLIYGHPHGDAAKKGDTVELPWAERIDNRKLRMFGHEAIWQPVASFVKDADLTIVTQENKLLANYLLQLRYLTGGARIAFGGHGRNYQSATPNNVSERIKRFCASKVHWWFTYTEGGARIVEGTGFPASRITVLNNSIDTRALVREAETVTQNEIYDFKRELGMTSSNVGVYVGGMYREKRLSFLIEAAQLVRKTVPDFHLILAGGGPDANIADEAADTHDFIHYLGPRFGREKTILAATAKVLLMPGLVGLAVLDSFAFGLPMVTTAVPYHSPEIEYLRNGKNGIIVSEHDSAELYAAAVSRLLLDEDLRQFLKEGGLEAARHYTIENMAENFCEGVLKALS